MHRKLLLPLALCGVLLAVGAGVSSASTKSSKVTITPAPFYSGAQLSQYAGNDWPTVGGDLQNDRYSTLTQITPANVGTLQLAWSKDMGVCAATVQAAACPGQESNAVVQNGIMYLSDSKSDVWAMDATTGNILWTYTPTFPTGYNIGNGGRNPGVSLGQGLVFLGQRNGTVVALNQGDGSVAWTASAGPYQKGITLSATPIYLNGELIVGNSGGDGGSESNAVMAFNATSGALMWFWNNIPAHNQPGGNTWPWSGAHSNYGGAAMWQNVSVDAKNNIVLFGDGNPVPWNSRGPGSDLWTDSMIALDSNTGQLKWAFQATHHDLWDNDFPNESILFDETVNGKTVPAVAAVAKMGWTWVFNRITGAPLEPIVQAKVPTLPNSADVNAWPTQPIPQTPNTLSGCIAGDPTSGAGANECYDQPLKGGNGRLQTNPIRWTGLTAPDGKPYDICAHFCPYDTTQYVTQPFESMDWPTSSYSPLTKEFITCGVTNRTYGKEQVPAASQVVGSAGGIGSGILSVADSSIDPLNLNDFGNFSALDMSTVSPTSGGKFAWHQIWPTVCYSGTVDTASGLTFVGHVGPGNGQTGLGYLAAVNTKTGAELWESPAGQMNAPATAPPITYAVNGTQYVSIFSGGESHNDPTRPNPAAPNQRVRGDTVYTYALGS
jgi:quinohemoprotein ethanol dehydrogenase